MTSELWQRLRAAIDYSGLRQQDIADACTRAGFKVNRSAVAQWVSTTEKNRTRPSIDQIKVVARETRLPVEFFLDDNVDPSDVWKIGGAYSASSAKRPRSKSVVSLPELEALPTLKRSYRRLEEPLIEPSLERRSDVLSENQLTSLTDGFKQAIRFQLLSINPDFDSGFNQELGNPQIPFVADYYCDGTVFKFGICTSEYLNTLWSLFGKLALLAHVQGGRPVRKVHVVLWYSPQFAPHKDLAITTMASFEGVMGTTYSIVSSPAQAAEVVATSCH